MRWNGVVRRGEMEQLCLYCIYIYKENNNIDLPSFTSLTGFWNPLKPHNQEGIDLPSSTSLYNRGLEPHNQELQATSPSSSILLHIQVNNICRNISIIVVFLITPWKPSCLTNVISAVQSLDPCKSCSSGRAVQASHEQRQPEQRREGREVGAAAASVAASGREDGGGRRPRQRLVVVP
jgi:hypothetical protein